MYKTTKVNIVEFTSFWWVQVRHERDGKGKWVRYNFWKDTVPKRWIRMLEDRVRQGRAVITMPRYDRHSITFTPLE